MQALPTEISVLAWSTALLALHVLLQSGLITLEKGLGYNAGPRDDGFEPQGKIAGRAKRALANFQETYPVFLGLAVALAATGRTGGNGAEGALIWFGARIVYLPLYLAGIPYIRTAVYAVSIWGLVRMVEQLLS